MKKIMIIAPFVFTILPILLLVLMIGAGEASQSSKVVASEEKAHDYQYVGQELGVPWDIIILADAAKAWRDGDEDIEEYNPILTALEFCILQEDVYRSMPVFEEQLFYTLYDVEINGIWHEVYHVYEMVQVGVEWVLYKTNFYTGCDEILAYIGRSRIAVNTKDATDIVVAIMEVAAGKSDDEWKYDNSLFGNLDYEHILSGLLGLDESDIKYIFELHHAGYMSELYGYVRPGDDMGEIDLPLISGDATRHDLAKIAVSLINWPYQLGSKSPHKGVPLVPLDCSGYVDWVYIQCFGTGVSAGGRVPAGVSVSGTAIQFYASDDVKSGLRIGDLGFTKHPSDVKPGEFNHVGIYLGTIGGQQAWIHCAGKAYGYDDRPSGRVGISLPSGTNNIDHISGTTYEPGMKSITFNYYRRPRYVFADD